MWERLALCIDTVMRDITTLTLAQSVNYFSLFCYFTTFLLEGSEKLLARQAQAGKIIEILSV